MEIGKDKSGRKEFLQNVAWIRDPANPIIPPDSKLGKGTCMNPWVIREGDTYFLFYASSVGPEPDGRSPIVIHLATASVDKPTEFIPYGPLFEHGPDGSFDFGWCVLPTVVKIREGLWYMFYTGNNGYENGLAAFPGIGLATSNDLYHWKKYGNNPVLKPSDFPWAIGMACGSLLKKDLPDGGFELRFYLVTCPTVGDDAFLDQQKRGSIMVSNDGINWRYGGEYLKRNIHNDYENVAATGGWVLEENGLRRLWYNGIGTRTGYYTICYAESGEDDLLYRGSYYGENMSLAPEDRPLTTDFEDNLWENQMVEYPSVIREGERLRLYYAGNGYGHGGIGTAVSADMRAAAVDSRGAIHLWVLNVPKCWHGNLTSGLSFAGMENCEFESAANFIHNGDFVFENHYRKEDTALVMRVIVFHHLEDIEIKYTFYNDGDAEITDVCAEPSFEERDTPFEFKWNEDCRIPSLKKYETVSRTAKIKVIKRG